MSKKQRELTQEEKDKILKNTPPYIEKCGVKNHERAKYISMIAQEVIGSQNARFVSMQPRLRDHSAYLEWNMAYAIVTNYLKDNNCAEVLKVIDYEFDNKSNPIQHPENLEESFEGSSKDFEALLEYIPTKTEAKFSNRLQCILPFLNNDYNNEEDDLEEDDLVNEDGGAFLTQPTATRDDNVGDEEIAVELDDDQEEDEGELFSIQDFASDDSNNA